MAFRLRMLVDYMQSLMILITFKHLHIHIGHDDHCLNTWLLLFQPCSPVFVPSRDMTEVMISSTPMEDMRLSPSKDRLSFQVGCTHSHLHGSETQIRLNSPTPTCSYDTAILHLSSSIHYHELNWHGPWTRGSFCFCISCGNCSCFQYRKVGVTLYLHIQMSCPVKPPWLKSMKCNRKKMIFPDLSVVARPPATWYRITILREH